MQWCINLPGYQLLVMMFFSLSLLSGEVPCVTAIAHSADTGSSTSDMLEYGTHDIREIARDPSHPLAVFISEKLKARVPVQCIWAEAAARYAEEGLHKEAWHIQESMLTRAVVAEEQLSSDTFRLICQGMVGLPTHFRKWPETEDALFLLFKGWQTNRHACTVLKDIANALAQNGQREKAIALAGRFVAAYPNDIIGVEAVHLVPASALLYLEIASEQQGTRVGAVAHYKLGETRAIQGKTAEAISAYNGFLRHYPDHKEAADALERLVRLCRDTGELEGALKHSNELLKYVVGKDAIRVRVNMAEIHKQLGNDAKFLATYLSILDKYQKWEPQEACRAVFDGANQAYREKMLHEAAALYEAYTLLLCQMNELPLNHLPKSEAADQERVAFWRACMEITAISKRQSVGVISGFCENHSHSLEAAYGHYVLAQLALEETRMQDALEHAEALVSLLPDSQPARRLVDEVHARVGSPDHEALDSGANPGTEPAELKDPEAMYTLAQNMTRSGASMAAIRHFNRLAAEWPESPLAARALFDAALIYRDKLKNHQKMLDRLECVLTLYPETELGATAMQQLNRIGKANE